MIRILFSLLITFTVLLGVNPLHAQISNPSDDDKMGKMDERPGENAGFKKERIYIGGNLSANTNNGFFVANVSPEIGYWFVPNRFLAAAGPTFVYFGADGVNQRYLGGHVLARYYVLENFFAHAEYELLNFKAKASGTVIAEDTFPVALLGGGYSQRIGNAGFFSATILYNFFADEQYNPYLSPFGTNNPIVRIGGGINL